MNSINDKVFKPERIHIDFELALSNPIIRVWNNSQIKYCFFIFNKLGKE